MLYDLQGRVCMGTYSIQLCVMNLAGSVEFSSSQLTLFVPSPFEIPRVFQVDHTAVMHKEAIN